MRETAYRGLELRRSRACQHRIHNKTVVLSHPCGEYSHATERARGRESENDRDKESFICRLAYMRTINTCIHTCVSVYKDNHIYITIYIYVYIFIVCIYMHRRVYSVCQKLPPMSCRCIFEVSGTMALLGMHASMHVFT